jgi:hypothetical protein
LQGALERSAVYRAAPTNLPFECCEVEDRALRMRHRLEGLLFAIDVRDYDYDCVFR